MVYLIIDKSSFIFWFEKIIQKSSLISTGFSIYMKLLCCSENI